MRAMKFPIRFLVLAGIIVAMAGCESSTVVTGKVTYKGEPVSTGSVTLVAKSGAVFTGNLNTDGTFSIPAVPTGEVQIAVVGANPGAGTKPPPPGRGQKGGGPAGIGRGGSAPKDGEAPPPPTPGGSLGAPAPAPKGPVLPAEYGDPRTSGLTGRVKSGEPLNIDLK